MARVIDCWQCNYPFEQQASTQFYCCHECKWAAIKGVPIRPKRIATYPATVVEKKKEKDNPLKDK